ncbi:MAG: hypothetical protein ACK5SI_16330 [Planctomycetia bacterium]|jgi:hypothetical protein
MPASTSPFRDAGRFPRRPVAAWITSPWLALCLALVPSAVRSAHAADLRPAWECLPEETAAVVRLPQPAAFLETLRTKTKFGTVLLSPARLDAMRKLLAKAGEDLPGTMPGIPEFPNGLLAGKADLEAVLGKYDLKTADIEAIFKQEIGLGVVVQPRPENPAPLVVQLTWIEPGEDAAGRMLAATKKAFEDKAKEGGDDGPRPRRIDLELAGHEVMWVIAPTTSIDLSGELNLDDADGEDVREIQKLQEKLRNAPRTIVGHVHTAITRIGPRLVMASLQTPLRPADGGQQPAQAGDEAAEQDMDRARGILQRFLTAHAGDGKAALAEVLQSPGLRANLPAGQQLLDVVVDPRVVIKALAAGNEETREAMKKLTGIGLADIGPCGWRHAFAEGRYQSAMVISLPAPRKGLMRILDQRPDPAEPPSFVTGDAIDFTQVSLDLGKAYAAIREYALAEIGEQAANMFNVGEANAQAVLGIDIPTVLSSFGSRHWSVNYPAKIAEAIAAGRGAAGGMFGSLGKANRGALVWKVADEPLILKLLQQAAPLAGGQIQEEQGFRGLRIPDGPAVFVGRDHLVIGIGAESLEKTLAAIRNPPADAASFGGGAAMRRARDLQPLDPALLVAISDATRSGGILGNVRQVVAAIQPEDVPEDERELFVQIQKVLPTADEMEGVFGVGVDTIRTTEHGLVLRSVWELPAP